jgi:hypothetical protein
MALLGVIEGSLLPVKCKIVELNVRIIGCSSLWIMQKQIIQARLLRTTQIGLENSTICSEFLLVKTKSSICKGWLMISHWFHWWDSKRHDIINSKGQFWEQSEEDKSERRPLISSCSAMNAFLLNACKSIRFYPLGLASDGEVCRNFSNPILASELGHKFWMELHGRNLASTVNNS